MTAPRAGTPTDADVPPAEAMAPSGPRKVAFVTGVGLCLVVFAVAWAGRAAEGTRALAHVDSALSHGETLDAILAARAAAEARCPFCSAPEQGYSRLERIAKDAEVRGDDATSFAAWRASRSAAVASMASGSRRDRADAELARLGHRLDIAAVAAGSSPTAAATEERLHATLATSSQPTTTTYALLAAGGVAFLAGASSFARGRGRRHVELVLAAVGAAVAAAALLLF